MSDEFYEYHGQLFEWNTMKKRAMRSDIESASRKPHQSSSATPSETSRYDEADLYPICGAGDIDGIKFPSGRAVRCR